MSDAHWAVGSEIAGYRLLRDFGNDVCGEIFLAEDSAQNPVTIHTLDPKLAADRCKLMDFYHQAKLGMAVDHPQVQQVLQVDFAADRHFVATEYDNLPSLKYQLQFGLSDQNRYEEHEAVHIVDQLAQILEDLHEDRFCPVVHRAVAPANILIDRRGQLVFNSLRYGSTIQHPLPYPVDGMTAELCQYLAPEQIKDRHHADPLADVYSLGVVLYTLLTGKTPFQGRDIQEILKRKKTHDFRSPETVVPGLSRSVVQLIRECLRADPDRRPASVRRFREFLDCSHRVVGGYQLQAYLGSGNSGDVYQAISPRGERVAIKLVAPKIAQNEKRLQRFYRGAKVSIQVTHPHLLEGIEVNQDNGQHFLATEFINGENLMWLVQKHGALPEAHVLRIGMQIASGLHHIHALNLVHRDIKPSNILIQPNGHVKLADLGFAKFMEPEEDMPDLTKAGRGLGTCQYVPPEQVSSAKEVDHRGDLYSLGVTLFVLLTGKLPFKPGGTLEMLMDKAINRFPLAKELNPQVSDATSRLVHWMMQAEPNNRPTSAESVYRAAEECLIRLESPHTRTAPKTDGQPVPKQNTPHPRPAKPQSRLSVTDKMFQKIVFGIGMLFVAMLAGLLLVNVW